MIPVRVEAVPFRLVGAGASQKVTKTPVSAGRFAVTVGDRSVVSRSFSRPFARRFVFKDVPKTVGSV